MKKFSIEFFKLSTLALLLISSLVFLKACGEKESSGCSVHSDCGSNEICKTGSCFNFSETDKIKEVGDVAIGITFPRSLDVTLNWMVAGVYHTENSDGSGLSCDSINKSIWKTDKNNHGPSPLKRIAFFDNDIQGCTGSCDNTELRIPKVINGTHLVYVRGFVRSDAGKKFDLKAHLCMKFTVAGEILRDGIKVHKELLEVQ